MGEQKGAKCGLLSLKRITRFQNDGAGRVGSWVMVGAKDIPERGCSAYDLP